MPASDSLSRTFSALADPTRREILSTLARGQATVGEVAARFEISAPAVSQHLNTLERAGLVERTACAQWRTLTIRTEPLDEVAAWVAHHRQDWDERLDRLDDHLRHLTTKEKDR